MDVQASTSPKWAQGVVGIVLILALQLAPMAVAYKYRSALKSSTAAMSNAPPALVFAIVWPILYLLIAIAMFLIIFYPQKDTAGLQWTAFAFLVLQLGVNWAWTPVYAKGGTNPAYKKAATGMIFIMLAMTSIAAVLCTRTQIVSAALLVPYIAWLLYASTLQ